METVVARFRRGHRGIATVVARRRRGHGGRDGGGRGRGGGGLEGEGGVGQGGGGGGRGGGGRGGGGQGGRGRGGGRTFSCNFCDRAAFLNLDGVINHQNDVHGHIKIKCKSCKRRFLSHAEKLVHEETCN